MIHPMPYQGGRCREKSFPSRLPADRHPWIRCPTVRGGSRPMRGRLRQLASHPFGSSVELVSSFSILLSLLLFDAKKNKINLRMWKTWRLYLVPVFSKCPQQALRGRLLWNMWNPYLVPMVRKPEPANATPPLLCWADYSICDSPMLND